MEHEGLICRQRGFPALLDVFSAGIFTFAVSWEIIIALVFGASRVDRLLLRLPLLGPMLRSYFIANSTRTFSSAIEKRDRYHSGLENRR